MMEFLAGCGCCLCPLSADKGSYNTYARERRQIDEQNRGLRNNDNANESLRRNTTIKSKRERGGNQEEETRAAGAEQDHQTGYQREQGIKGKGRVKGKGVEKTMEQNGPVLSSFTLEGIAELINENKISPSSIIVLVGAGMSTAAGVPDFRSPDTGIYANLQKYNLPHPEDVFKITYFKNNPAPFYDLSRQLLPSKLYPTLSHYFVRMLHEKGLLLRCFSQNVDCLESLSGIPKDKLCLAHGSFETGHCLRCNAEYSLAWMRKIVEEGGIPHCTKTRDCKGLIKPDLKFFGERLDGRYFRLVKEDFPNCELLIIIGCSLTVMPFAQLIHKVPPNCPRLLINKTKSGHNIPAIFRIFSPSNGLMYDKKGNTRDVAYLGNSDDACLKLATLLGWNGELIELANSRRQELEQQFAERTSDEQVSVI